MSERCPQRVTGCADRSALRRDVSRETGGAPKWRHGGSGHAAIRLTEHHRRAPPSVKFTSAASRIRRKRRHRGDPPAEKRSAQTDRPNVRGRLARMSKDAPDRWLTRGGRATHGSSSYGQYRTIGPAVSRNPPGRASEVRRQIFRQTPAVQPSTSSRDSAKCRFDATVSVRPRTRRRRVHDPNATAGTRMVHELRRRATDSGLASP